MRERLAVFLDYQNVHLTAQHSLRGLRGSSRDHAGSPLLVAERIAGQLNVSNNLATVAGSGTVATRGVSTEGCSTRQVCRRTMGNRRAPGLAHLLACGR